MIYSMSNRDYSGTTLAMQKRGQTEYAEYVQKRSDTNFTRGLLRMSGGATAGTVLELAVGATASAAANYGGPLPTNAYSASYNISRNILARLGN